MGIISNCFGFNFSKGENSNKKTKPNFLLVSLESRGNQICWLKIRRRKMKMILVWQVWGRSAAVVCHHRELQQLLNRHCRFFSIDLSEKKGNLKGCQKCWDYLDIFALHYWTLIFASYSFTSGHPFLSFNIDWRISILEDWHIED